jgi:hypothetical protein
MYCCAEDAGEGRLDNLEMLLHGYAIAVVAHGVNDPGGEFLRAFGDYLRDRFGWSMSCGAIDAIRRSAHDEGGCVDDVLGTGRRVSRTRQARVVL